MSVFRKASAVMSSTLSSLPALNPYQPNQSSPVPSAMNGMLCGRVDELAPADVQHRRERGPAGAGVDDDAAGEVAGAPVREQAAAPEHVHERVVDGELPHDEEQQVRLEGHPVRERARDQRRCDDREHHLVGDQHDERDAGRLVQRVHADVAQERQMEVAVDPIRPAVEAERVADRPPEHGRDPHRREALDHDRQDVRAADEPAVEEREPRRHQHHEARSDEHESGVCSVEHRPSFRCRWPLVGSNYLTVKRSFKTCYEHVALLVVCSRGVQVSCVSAASGRCVRARARRRSRHGHLPRLPQLRLVCAGRG